MAVALLLAGMMVAGFMGMDATADRSLSGSSVGIAWPHPPAMPEVRSVRLRAPLLLPGLGGAGSRPVAGGSVRAPSTRRDAPPALSAPVALSVLSPVAATTSSVPAVATSKPPLKMKKQKGSQASASKGGLVKSKDGKREAKRKHEEPRFREAKHSTKYEV